MNQFSQAIRPRPSQTSQIFSPVLVHDCCRIPPGRSDDRPGNFSCRRNRPKLYNRFDNYFICIIGAAAMQSPQWPFDFCADEGRTLSIEVGCRSYGMPTDKLGPKARPADHGKSYRRSEACSPVRFGSCKPTHGSDRGSNERTKNFRNAADPTEFWQGLPSPLRHWLPKG